MIAYFEPTYLLLGISQCFCMVKFRIKFHQFLLSCLCASQGWNHHLHNIVATLDQEAGNTILTQHNNFYTKLPICITLFIFAQRIELIPSSQFTPDCPDFAKSRKTIFLHLKQKQVQHILYLMQKQVINFCNLKQKQVHHFCN